MRSHTRILAWMVVGTFAIYAGVSAQTGVPSTSPARMIGVPASRPAASVLKFSGYEWTVKDSGNRAVGPGPNRYSRDCVEVDDQGRLHMRVINNNGVAECAEILLPRSLGYGTYRFALGSSIEHFDPNMVLGLFTWDDSPASHHREIDIELSQWAKPNDINAQFVIQPYPPQENLVRFNILPGDTDSVQEFTWKPGMVICRSWAKSSDVAAGMPMEQHVFTSGISAPGGEAVHINLWFYKGVNVPGNSVRDVIIKSFSFEPLK